MLPQSFELLPQTYLLIGLGIALALAAMGLWAGHGGVHDVAGQPRTDERETALHQRTNSREPNA